MVILKNMMLKHSLHSQNENAVSLFSYSVLHKHEVDFYLSGYMVNVTILHYTSG